MTDPLAWSASLGFEDATGGVGASVLSCNPNCSGADLNALTDTIYRAREDVGSELVAAGVDAPEEVFEGEQSVVFDEAENRIHAQKSVLLWCFDRI
jgi:ornithine carbamoyltransferase